MNFEQNDGQPRDRMGKVYPTTAGEVASKEEQLHVLASINHRLQTVISRINTFNELLNIGVAMVIGEAPPNPNAGQVEGVPSNLNDYVSLLERRTEELYRTLDRLS